MRRSKELTELARMRIAAKMLQKELADALGIKRTHLQKLEAGIRKSARVQEAARRLLCTSVHS